MKPLILALALGALATSASAWGSKSYYSYQGDSGATYTSKSSDTNNGTKSRDD